MEKTTLELIMKMQEIDARLKYLYEQHEKYERELMEYGRRSFLTEEEQQKEKQIKFAKLKGKEKMMELLSALQEAA